MVWALNAKHFQSRGLGFRSQSCNAELLTNAHVMPLQK